MGMFDTIYVPCPKCGERYPAQSKSGDCYLSEFELDDAPNDALRDVNRHAPFTCEKCGAIFRVELGPEPPIPRAVVLAPYAKAEGPLDGGAR